MGRHCPSWHHFSESTAALLAPLWLVCFSGGRGKFFRARCAKKMLTTERGRAKKKQSVSGCLKKIEGKKGIYLCRHAWPPCVPWRIRWERGEWGATELPARPSLLQINLCRLQEPRRSYREHQIPVFKKRKKKKNEKKNPPCVCHLLLEILGCKRSTKKFKVLKCDETSGSRYV